jgi:hypothetical protein
MRGKIALLVFLLWTVWVVPAGAVGNGWQVLTTPHFTFYAQADQVNIMQKLAAIAEEVHPLVVTYVGHEPTEKTHVVIMDISDLLNGMASATFYNQIICFPVHPGNSVAYSSGLGSRTDDWLRTLFIHEYTHILQMDIPSGLAGIIRRCFGHVPGASTPNGLQPLLSIEGLAVHAETLLTEAGRGDDPLYHMFLRTAVLDGKLLRLDQAMNNYYLSRWDPAGAPYLYGASLTEYIARHYGVYALQQVNQMGSSWSNSLYQVLGISLPELWAGWEHEITEKYIEQAEKVQETPLTELVPLGSHGDLTLHPAISPDDSTLAYIATDGVPSGIYLQSLADDVDLEVLAKQTPGFSGADLENVLNEAAILAARRNRKVVGHSELEEAVDRVVMGPERKRRRMTAKDKEILAYHEAGHAVVAHYLPNADPVHKVTIVGRGMAGGYTMVLPEEERMVRTRAEMKDILAFMLGGRAAEEVVYESDEITTGAQNDLERVTLLARKMVTEWGMSETLGPITYGHQHEETIFLGRDIARQRNYSEDVAATIDNEVRAIVQDAHNRAISIIKEQWDRMQALVEVLKEKETVNQETFLRIMREGRVPTEEVVEAGEPSSEAKKPAPAPSVNPLEKARESLGLDKKAKTPKPAIG